VVLFPFEEDPAYKLVVKIKFIGPTVDGQTFAEALEGEHGSIVTTTGQFESGDNWATSEPVDFASDETYTYYISLFVAPLGVLKKHTIGLYYTLLRVRK
jgi:hypothetical protein